MKNSCCSKDFKVENFPSNVKDLLCLVAKDESNRLTLILNTYEDSILEDVCLVGVIGCFAIFKYHKKLKFVKIDCICTVIVDSDIFLDELIDSCKEWDYSKDFQP